MQQTQDQFEKFEELFLHHQKIEIVYENMISGGCLSDQATEDICTLLNIEKRPICCDLVKTNPNKLNLMIDNYDEIVSSLKGTPYERFIDS